MDPLFSRAVGGFNLLLRPGAWDEKFKNIEKTTDTLEQGLKALHDKVDQVLLILARRETIRNTSPLTLTEVGQAISTELGAQVWAEEAAAGLKGRFVDPTPYQIQEFCFNYVTGPDVNFLEQLTFEMQNSAYRHGVSLQGVYNVLAIKLRDEILKMHHLDPPE